MLFAAETAIFLLLKKPKKGSGSLLNHSEDLRKNIELLAHTELLQLNTQLHNNASMYGPRENQFHLPSASERSYQLYEDSIRH